MFVKDDVGFSCITETVQASDVSFVSGFLGYFTEMLFPKPHFAPCPSQAVQADLAPLIKARSLRRHKAGAIFIQHVYK